jgi:hypothetical protein
MHVCVCMYVYIMLLQVTANISRSLLIH